MQKEIGRMQRAVHFIDKNAEKFYTDSDILPQRSWSLLWIGILL